MKQSRRWTATKLTGAGNSFLLIDLRSKPNLTKGVSRKKLAQSLCDPHFSVGADGLIFLFRGKKSDLAWDFYNADGSRAEMCGNAARCVGRYMQLNSRRQSAQRLTLQTQAGLVALQIAPARPGASVDLVPVVVYMPPISKYETNLVFSHKGKKLHYDFVNSGVPHAVIRYTTSTNLLRDVKKNVDKFGSIVNNIRALTRFKSKGVNVTFYVKKSKSAIESLTFERGVPGYTLACGTGAIAAAYSYSLGGNSKIQVNVPGGQLQVVVQSGQIKLGGPAQFIAQMQISLAD